MLRQGRASAQELLGGQPLLHMIKEIKAALIALLNALSVLWALNRLVLMALLVVGKHPMKSGEQGRLWQSLCLQCELHLQLQQ